MAALLRATRESSWRVPVNLGYALLEQPGPRKGSRDARLHAFAEHRIGLIRYTPVRQAIERISLQTLWRHGWDGDQFLVTNRPDVVLMPGIHG